MNKEVGHIGYILTFDENGEWFHTLWVNNLHDAEWLMNEMHSQIVQFNMPVKIAFQPLPYGFWN